MTACPKADNRDKSYYKHWTGLCRLGRATCFVTGDTLSVVPHHVQGKHRFGDKWNICPLGFRPHQYYHQHGETMFVERYGVTDADMKAEATQLYDAYLSHHDRHGLEDGSSPT